ncbi:MAG TPA: EthD domain-containing protein [Solirubrobacteraceae bacterium]|jgi:uncharacterized protein (TIGR02118 family)|nr:EthD domain-containing protein [Solirubrobacteraceae bacterium]
MYKVMVLIKRRQGVSTEEFMDYYENHHQRLGARVLPTVRRYTRSHLSPMGSYAGEEPPEPPYDVATELVFEDEAACQAAMEQLAQPETMAEVLADEERPFDRSTITFLKVQERSTDMAAAAAG